MKRINTKIVFIALLPILCVGSSFAWWQHNRMDLLCLLRYWGDGSPGRDAYIKLISEGKENEVPRLYEILKHTEFGKCASLDKEKYWEDIKKASEEYNWPEAHYMLSLIYGYGYDPNYRENFVGIDKEKMREQGEKYWFDFSTGAGEKRGDEKNLDLEKSFALLEKAAKGGCVLAHKLLSYVYHSGEWGRDGRLKIEPDPYKSLAYVEEWAKEGGRGKFYAGYRYRYGDDYGIESNYKKAHDYFVKAAAHRTDSPIGTMAVDAMVELAVMYGKGIGVEQDKGKAAEWINKATEIAKDENDKIYIEQKRQEI